MVDPWAELGIPETRDVREIKKAYAARLKLVHPEDDAEGFQRLRQAYEMALGFARWKAAEAAGPAQPDPGEPPWRPRVHVRPLDAASPPPDAASALLRRLEELQADASQRASEPAWRALLSSETLWNLDTRHVFELSLIDRLLSTEFVLAPVAWALLQEEFHWTEQSLAFYQTLPHDSIERLMRRMTLAPVEFGARLCDEGRYEEARALAREVVKVRHSALSRAAQQLLTRCTAEETADAALRDVERLRADAAAWASSTEWRALVERPALQKEFSRRALQRKLFNYLAACGSALPGPVWLLLDRSYHWTRTLTDGEWARAASALGPAVVEASEGLERQGQGREAIAQLGRVAAHLEGELGRRAREILERCCRRTLERAEELERLGSGAEALAEAAPVAALAGGELASRARTLVDRAGRATVESARAFLSKHRYQDAVGRLERVIDLLPGALATEGRLVLARSFVGAKDYPAAESWLEQVLAAEPSSVPAAQLMVFVLRERGQLGHAAALCQRILAIEPGNERAARELHAIEKEMAQAQAPSPAPEGAGSGVGVVPLLVIMGLFNALRSCAPSGPHEGSTLDGAKWLGVLVLLALGAAVMLAARSHRRVARLLETDLVPSPWRSAGLLALGGVVIVAAFCIAIWLASPSDEAPTAAVPAWKSVPASRPVPFAPRSWAREVRIVDFGASQSLPLKGGSRVTLWADVRYTLAAGTGVVKLFATGDPGGEPREIAAVQVARPSGVVRLQGGYWVPPGARKVDLLVPFSVLGSESTSVAANAFLAVED